MFQLKKNNITGENMNEAACLHNSPLTVLAHKKTKEKEDGYFTDNLTHVEFLVAEVKLWIALAYLRLKHIEKFSNQDSSLAFLGIPADVGDLSGLEQRINDIAARKRDMEKATGHQNIKLKFYELVQEYKLDDFEKKVLQLLFVTDTSLEFKSMFEQCEIDYWNNGFRASELEIGVILSILCKNYHDQLACRSCFSIDRPLVKFEIIRLSGRHSGFLATDVELHERISRFCLDDHNVYDTELLCISAERPAVKFSQVILDESVKSDLLRYVESFIDNSKRGQGLSKAFGYGAGLTCLFYGLSGTGKTMLAHGIANHLGCKLYSVNIGGLEHEEISFEDAIKYIFKEAKLSNGIVFLDECDDLLTDNSKMSRTFLIEVEKAECITILATNKTVQMDPALDRRISLKVPFGLPEENERLAIWQALLPEGMKYGGDIDLQALAAKYKFTGGLIKNTLLMAAGRALVKNKSGGDGVIIIDGEEIHKAAQHQAKSMFDLGALGQLITPKTMLNELPIRRIDRERLKSVVEIIPELQRNNQGFCGLVCSENIQSGVKGVEAVAAETGLMIRQYSLPKILLEGSPSHPDMSRIVDPFTQQPISLLEYVFVPQPGQQEILVLVDDSHIIEEILNSENKDKKLRDWLRFKGLMREFKGILFVISKPVPKQRVPIEFSCHLFLRYPSEDVQIQTWQGHFPEISDNEVMGLVERFPMYSQEINLIARQAKIQARLEGLSSTGVSGLTIMANRLRGKRKMPVLFGD